MSKQIQRNAASILLMNPVSAEQALIIHNVKTVGTNVVVDAVAGSGKSTTILSLAKAMPKHKIIQITYNSMLRCEIKQKVEEHVLDNLDVHTYHSLAVKYYFASAYTDTGIRHIMKTGLPPRIHIPRKHIIVVDEAQDLTRLQCRVISQYVSRDQLTLVGDMNQATRTGNLETWESLSAEFDVKEPRLMSLLQNYRVPQNIYDYARQYLSENDRIDTPSCDVEGGQVSLLKVEQSDALEALLDLVRTLSMQDGRIAVITDTEIFASEVKNLGITNVVALTPEESKGLEVDHSVLIQPNRWFKNSGRIRNLMYVTLTRATKSVTIIQHDPERFGILEPTQLIEA